MTRDEMRRRRGKPLSGRHTTRDALVQPPVTATTCVTAADIARPTRARRRGRAPRRPPSSRATAAGFAPRRTGAQVRRRGSGLGRRTGGRVGALGERSARGLLARGHVDGVAASQTPAVGWPGRPPPRRSSPNPARGPRIAIPTASPGSSQPLPAARRPPAAAYEAPWRGNGNARVAHDEKGGRAREEQRGPAPLPLRVVDRPTRPAGARHRAPLLGRPPQTPCNSAI